MTDNASSLATLYAAEQDRLCRRLTMRGLNAAQAADAVQELFLRLMRLPIGEIRDPGAYLRRAADTLAIDHWRAQKRAKDLFEPLPVEEISVADGQASAEAGLIAQERGRKLREAIATLPPRSREALLLHKYEGLSYAEIALRLGIARNTVMVHLANAMRSLRAALNDSD